MPLVCFIELDKTDGVTVSVKDDQGKVTQTIRLDGERLVLEVETKDAKSRVEQKDGSIVSTVKDSKETSTIEQKPGSIEMTCKTFTVKAEEVRVSSSKDTRVEAKGSMKLDATKDLAMSTSAKASLSASRDASISAGTKLDLAGQQQASLSAAKVSVDGKMKTAITAGTLLDASAAKVSIKGKAQLEAAAPITNVGQNMTSIRGQLVKIEGMMVKLG